MVSEENMGTKVFLHGLIGNYHHTNLGGGGVKLENL